MRARAGDLAAAASLVTVGVFAVLIVAGGRLAPADPQRGDLAASALGPGAGHPLGTDELGRDILSRLLAGTQDAIVGPLAVALATTLIATALGLLAGYRGGWADAVVMRCADFAHSLPVGLLTIVVVGVIGGGYPMALVTLTVLAIPADTRVVRGVVLAQRGLPYLEAAQVLGLRRTRIAIVHLLPNVAPTVVANCLLTFVYALVSLSALSFLGLGSPAGSPDWGRMLFENRTLLDLNPWASITPALLIVLAAVSMTVLGDRLLDRALDRSRT
ncbi:ABC transporter permease [Nonomuraea pusilla]|uniref:Peptide/nickel transport system permease protein n=1 Tax=Nonomuraea pusilla TaxID=46177 RepID=A0A1H7Y9E2_9ACTN|nr:ABC transporter permease [Nonomuraea pusilla]SEM42494.1 peptide/nickel transport system permease protein [Nonomuraea pusilla]